MSSYGITDHQTGLSIVSQNIGAIGRIANYQINNRKKFMGPFRRYKTNMERRALSLISLPWRGARGSQPHSVSQFISELDICGKKEVFSRLNSFLSFSMVTSFSMFACLDYLVVLPHLFEANVLGPLKIL